MPSQQLKPKIGVALGGGGIRGFAHLAVIEGMAAAGIKPDLVAGTSIGSGMAALLACGRTQPEVIEFALNTEIVRLFSPGGHGGLLNSRKYAETFAELVGIERVEQAPIPLSIVATDLVSWQPYIFTSGELATAIQASSAVPGAFRPVAYEDVLLVDGGLVDNCPTDLLRQQGADIVVAVDLDYRSHTKPKNIFEIAQRSLEITISQARRPLNADYVITPFNEGYISAAAVLKYRNCYEYGKRAAAEQLPGLKRYIQEYYERRGLDWRQYLPELLN